MSAPSLNQAVPLDQLIEGYRRFRARDWVDHREHYQSLNERQQPGTCVISCCDSRVDPMSIFDAMPVEMGIPKARAVELATVRPTPGMKIDAPMMVTPVRIVVGAGAMPIVMMAAHGRVIVTIVMRTVAVGEAIGRHPRAAVMIAGPGR